MTSLQDEIEDAVDYVWQYLSLESTDYRKVWCTTFTFAQLLVLGPTFCFCVSWCSAYLFLMVGLNKIFPL